MIRVVERIWRSRRPADAEGLSVLVDPLGTIPLRHDLDVYHDVYGLTKGARYAVRFELSHKAGGIRGILGGNGSSAAASHPRSCGRTPGSVLGLVVGSITCPLYSIRVFIVLPG